MAAPVIAVVIKTAASALDGIKDEEGKSLLSKLLWLIVLIIAFVIFLLVAAVYILVNSVVGLMASLLGFNILPCDIVATPCIAEFPLPTYMEEISNPYGAETQFYPFHTGVDFPVPEGTNVVSVYEGKVVDLGYMDEDFGNWVLIRHDVVRLIDDGESEEESENTSTENALGEVNLGKYEVETFYSFYAHLDDVVAIRNQTVTTNQVIGLSGGNPEKLFSGNSTGAHLHFEIRENEHISSAKNPYEYIGVG